MENLSVSLLGTFRASLDGNPITQFRTKSVQALFIYLVCEAERPSSREQLMDLLWPGMPQASAQGNMRQTLYRLRKLIPEIREKNGETAVPFLITNRQSIQINPDADYYADIHAFTSLIDNDPEKAIGLYRGDFLSGFYLADSETFEGWANNQRELYRRQALAAMERVTAVSIQNANYEQAIKLAQRQLEIDNLRERSHRQLMEAWAKNGRRREALSHYQKLQQLLQDELAIDPSQETQSLIEIIRTDNLSESKPSSDQESIFLSNTSTQPKHNLPRRLTSFIGRERELATITRLIRDNHLVMLTGVGGIGKTNLSLQAGQQMLDEFPDGVWLVELAPIADPEMVTQTTAHALGLRPASDRPILEVLLDFLKDKESLIILDNCEHVIHTAADLVKTLLQACPDITILTSSREALGVPGEMIYQVPSLIVPRATQQIRIDEWERFDALRLFVERGTAVLPDFQVTEDNFQSLVQICQRLDGIPLALELAAARLKVLSTEQILHRLDNRFKLLTGGRRTALPRQQTLRALIDWSWELLSNSEKILLQRLSVFSGGMRLDAVEAVCASDELDAYEILDLLTELVNKSLVISRREQGKETRYFLLETIRQYAQERLTEAGDSATYRDRHLDHFLQLCQQSELELISPDQVAWLKQLEQEMDNLRIALNWAEDTDVEAGLRIIVSSRLFWFERALMQEGEAWLERLLKKSDGVTPEAVASAMIRQAEFAIWTNFDRAKLILEDGLAFSRDINYQLGIAWCLTLLGIINRDDRKHQKNLFIESIALFRVHEDKYGLAHALIWAGFFELMHDHDQASAFLAESEALYIELGHVGGKVAIQGILGYREMSQGNFAAARLYFEEELAISESIGKYRTSWALLRMGNLHYWLGEYNKAEAYFKKSLSLRQQIDSSVNENWGHAHLGYVYLGLRDYKLARKELIEALHLFQAGGVRDGIGFTIEGLARMATDLEEPKRAIRLFAWTDGLREEVQNPRPPVEEAAVAQVKERILQMIGEEAYLKAYEEGKSMSQDEAIAYALENNQDYPLVT